VILNQIATALKASPQSVQYQINQLDGIIVRTPGGYSLQPFLRDKSIDDCLFNVFAETLKKNKFVSDDAPEIITEGIALLCEAFLDDVRRLLKTG
jgi:hypothetical protein